MSSNSKDEVHGAIMVASLIGGAILMIGIVIFFIAAFITFILSILAIVAMASGPLQLGTVRIEPDEARAFLLRGIAGAFAIPAFFAFLDIFLGVAVDWRNLNVMMVAGYMVFSLGFEILVDELDGGEAQKAGPPAQPVLPAQQQTLLPPPQAPHPQRYASWDDEEELR